MDTIAIIGCGALGSRIAVELEGQFVLYDNDRVSHENIGTSLYLQHHLGKSKVMALSQILSSRGKQSRTVFTDVTVSKVSTAYLYVDCLDNPEARNSLASLDPMVHVGVGEFFGEVRWGDVLYQPIPEGSMQICTRDLGIPIILMTAAAGIVSIRNFLSTGEKTNFIVNSSGEVHRA